MNLSGESTNVSKQNINPSENFEFIGCCKVEYDSDEAGEGEYTTSSENVTGNDVRFSLVPEDNSDYISVSKEEVTACTVDHEENAENSPPALGSTIEEYDIKPIPLESYGEKICSTTSLCVQNTSIQSGSGERYSNVDGYLKEENDPLTDSENPSLDHKFQLSEDTSNDQSGIYLKEMEDSNEKKCPMKTEFSHLSCTVCEKSFSKAVYLKRHMRIHKNEKPFVCNICGNSFSFAHHLRRHLRTHTGEKPYTCSVCGKSFAQSNGFARHMRVHTGEKPFLCYVCGNSFSVGHHLRDHMRKHTGEKPFSCSECGESFYRKLDLERHSMIKHTGEKPFLCTECGKSFSRKSHLDRHTQSHSGEKSFACATCGKAFTRKPNLEIHKKKHTGQETFLPTGWKIPFPQDTCLK